MPNLDDLLKQAVPTKTLDDLMDAPIPKVSVGHAESGQGFWKSLIENPITKTPFLGSVVKAGRFTGVTLAAKRLQDPTGYEKLSNLEQRMASGMGELDPGYIPQPVKKISPSEKARLRKLDIQLVENYLTEVNKKYTGLGKVGNIVGEMPSFIVEFLATGGLKHLGEKGALKVGEKLLKEKATSILGKAVIGTGKYTAGAALRSAGLPQRAAVAILKRQLPTGITYGTNNDIFIKDSGEKPLTSVIKGLGDHYIEILSEQAGEIVSPIIGKSLLKTPFLGKVLSKIQTKWLKLHPKNNMLDFAKKISTKSGFDGVISEIGEEYYGNQLRAIFNINDFGAGKDSGILERMAEGIKYDTSNLPIMIGAFSIPGVARAGLGFNVKGSETPQEATKDITAPHSTQIVSEGITGITEEQFNKLPLFVRNEANKLMSVGLSMDEAISTLQTLQSHQAEEITHKEQIETEVKEITDTLIKQHGNILEEGIIGNRQSKVKEAISTAKDATSYFHWGMMRIGRILEWLDGKKDGPLNRFILQPMRTGVAKSAFGKYFRMNELDTKIKDLNIDLKELYGKRIQVTDKLTLTPNDLLEVYLATKDKQKLTNLKEGNNFTDTDIDAVIKTLLQDPRLIQLGDWVLEKYSSDFDEIADKYNKTTGKVLDKISGYSPIRRIRKGWARFKDADEEFDDMLHHEILGEGIFKKKAVPKGFTKPRTKATGPLNLDAIGNYITHARAVEHYKAMVIPTYNVNKLINNNQFRKLVDKKTRGAGNKILNKWLQDVASERTSLENTMLSHTVGVLRRNAVVSALGLNIISALKQPVSLSLALAENPKMIPLWTKAMVSGIVNPKAFKDFIHKRTILVRHRNMEREIREMSQRRSIRQQIKGKRSLSEKVLFFIRLLDQITVHTVWKAAYDMALQDTIDEEQAIKYADSVIERTQPMADIMDLPHFFRGSELHKMFTVFQNQINQNYNYWANDIIGVTKRGELSKEMLAYRVLMSTILPAAVLGLITRGFTPGNPKEWAKDLASFMVSPIFIFGKIISSIIQGYDPSTYIAFGAAGEFYDAARTKEPGAKIIHLLGGTAKAAGIPWSQPKRSIKGLIAINDMETNDPRRLIWSKQALERGTK